MPALVISSDQQAAIAAADAYLDSALSSGSGGVAALAGYGRLTSQQRQLVRDTYRLAMAAAFKASLPDPVWASDNSPSLTSSTESWTDFLTASVSFEQVRANQIVEARFELSAYASISGCSYDFRLMYDGNAQAPYSAEFRASILSDSEHQGFAFSWLFAGSAVAGTKNVKIQFMRSSGTGTLNLGPTDHWSLIVR